jgi:hypothetical protein
MTVPAAPSRAPFDRPAGVLVASTLCWIVGILCALGAIGLFAAAGAVPALAQFGTVAAILVTVFAVAYITAGVLVRQGSTVGAWIGLIISGVTGILQLFGLVAALAGGGRPQITAILGPVINAAIFVLLLVNWRYFRTASADTG